MIGIIRAWIDSLAQLAPSSLKQWMLLALKRAGETYALAFRYCWWLLVLLMGALYGRYYVLYEIAQLSSRVSSFFSFSPGNAIELKRQAIHYEFLEQLFFGSIVCLGLMWLFCCFLLVRPSIAKKNNWYVMQYARYLISYSILIVLMGLLYVGALATCKISSSLFCTILLGPLIVLGIVYASVVLFFTLDTKKSLFSLGKNIGYGIKLVWYRLPLFILLSAILYGYHCGSAYLERQQFFTYQNLLIDYIHVLLIPLILSIIIYMYITEVHTHPERYV